MRNIAEHRIDGDFQDAVQGIIRNSPWWMISAVAHLVALAILWSIPFNPKIKEAGRTIQATLPQDLEKPEDIKPEPPEPEQPPEDIEEEPLETDFEDEVNSDDTDEDQLDTANDDGTADSEIGGPLLNAIVGIGGNAGGGPSGPGGRLKARAKGKWNLTDNAVELGLKWLADHQDYKTDGRWDCDNFMKHDPADDRCDGPGHALHDVGVSGLALLAFLGAGYTDRGTPEKNRFARHVRRGLRFLRSSQSEDGVFGTRAAHSFMYSHIIATLAMCETYWMTRNPRYKKPAQDGLNFISRARNPYMAWRYEPRGGDNDTSVTGWAVMALKSGRFAGLEVDPAAFDGARLWIDKMTDVNFGQVGYDFPGGAPARPEGKADRFPPEKSQSMTAAGVLTRIFLGEDPRTSEMIHKGANLCLEVPPKWDPDDGSIDMYYWYYATLALFQVGGSHWKKWNKHMKDAIVLNQHQKDSGRRTGSWDPIGAWGDDGGRVYSTATMVMCLEVYYRYDRVWGAR